MRSNGNSFGVSNGQSMSAAPADPEATEREGFPLGWAWSGFQKPGNAL